MSVMISMIVREKEKERGRGWPAQDDDYLYSYLIVPDPNLHDEIL